MGTPSSFSASKARIAAVLVITTVLVAGTGGVALLRADGGNPDLLHACVKKSSGKVKVLGHDETCDQGWSSVHLPLVTTDDLADAIATAPDGSRIDVACGVYDITAAITISQSLHVAGASTDCVIIRAAAPTINLFDVTAHGVTLENLTLMGDGTTSGVGNGNLVSVTSDGDFAVRNSRFLDWGQDALRIVKTTGSAHNIRIESNHFVDGVDNAGFQHDVAIVGAVSGVFIAHNQFAAHQATPVEFSVFVSNSTDQLFRDIVVSGNRMAGSYGRSCLAMTDETPDGSLRVHSVTISDNVIRDCRAQAIHLKNVPRHTITGNRIADVNGSGIGGGLDGDITINGGLQGAVTGNSISGGKVGIMTTEIPNTSGSPALLDGFNVSGNVIKLASSDGVRLSTGTRGAVVAGNTVLDCGSAGVAVLASAAVEEVAIDGNVVRGCKFGVATIGAITVRPARLLISNNVIADSELSGIQVREIDQSLIVDNLIHGSGTAAADQSGINLTMSDGVLIAGNVIGLQDRGISLGGGTANIEIIDNDLRNNFAAAIVNPHVAAELRGNIGFATERSGIATIGALATAVTFDHGLDIAPGLEDVQVTALGSLGAASQFWVSAVNPTSITLNVDAAPGSDVSFAWQVG